MGQRFVQFRKMLICICIESLEKAIGEGLSPAIQFSDRRWNDESSGITIRMKTPTEVFLKISLGLF